MKIDNDDNQRAGLWQSLVGALLSPLALVIVALAGVAFLVVSPAAIVAAVPLDAWQIAGIWLAILSVALVQTRRGSGRHRAIWSVLVAVLLFSFLENYSEFVSLQDRLARLHGDEIAQGDNVAGQLLKARYEAQTLSDDLDEWTVSTVANRPNLEARITSDLINLDGRIQGATTQLQALADRLTPAANGQQDATLSQSTLASVHNLATDSAQEVRAIGQTLAAVRQTWDVNRDLPDSAAQLQFTVNPRLWNAIDTGSGSATRLSDALTRATNVPVGDLFVVIAVLNLSAVLFPWLLLLLFISGRRETRLRQIYMDLWSLGGQTNRLLVRSLDVDDASLDARGYDKPIVRARLQDQTFSDLEYLLSLSLLTIILSAGWHLVLYPMGALGLAQLVVTGVSVRDFALYVAGNLNVVTMGFLGAYFYGIGILLRRFFASDLYPAAFLQMVYRLLIILVISLVVTIFVPIASVFLPEGAKLTQPFSGLPVAPNGGKPLDGVGALAGALAFFFGVWTSAFYRWVPRVVSSVPGMVKQDNPQPSVAELEGVDLWVESRLNEEGVETVQAMATVSIERLVRRTYFSTARIVCWIDQALLYMHAGNNGEWMPSFRAAGIHRAADLINALGYPYLANAEEVTDGATRTVDLDALRDAVDTLVAAGPSEQSSDYRPLVPAMVFEVCRAVLTEPNLVHVFNFYRAHAIPTGSALVGWGAIKGQLVIASMTVGIARDTTNGLTHAAADGAGEAAVRT